MKFVKEIAIVIASLIAAWLITYILTQIMLGNAALDINLHDTYIINKSPWYIPLLRPFLLCIIFIFVIRGSINNFKSRTQNLFLLISTLLLNIAMLYSFEVAARFSGLTSHGWTIYPPLSALPDHPPFTPPHTSPFDGRVQLLFIIQIILLVLLVIIAVLTGKNWKTNKNAHPIL